MVTLELHKRRSYLERKHARKEQLYENRENSETRYANEDFTFHVIFKLISIYIMHKVGIRKNKNSKTPMQVGNT